VLLSLVIGHAVIGPAAPSSAQFGNGNVQDLAHLIFTKYVFAFELTSALLITAALGAMVLAHRERATPKPTQRELASQRVASGRPTPLPGPGTYAQHNGADMPALLPDGGQSRLSVSHVLAPAEEPQDTQSTPLPSGASVAGTQAGAGRPAGDGGQEAGEQW
jgi:NADH-quinone oxidoreductase subunit J